jgi:hypothetical protein
MQKDDSSKDYNDTDTFFRIDAINLSFGNVTGILSSCDTHVLYMMSRKNGLCDSFPEWYGLHPTMTHPTNPAIPNVIGGIGSVLCLEFGSDIPMVPEFHPGMAGSFNFQINSMSVTYLNRSVTITNPVLYVMTQTDSYLHMGDTVTRVAGVVADPNAQYVAYNNVAEYYGGSLKDKIMKLLPYVQKINQYLKDSKIVSNTALQIPHPIAQTISGVAKSMGYGVEDGGMVAGKLMTNAEIKKRVRKLR